MFAPLFDIAAASAEVRALLGSGLPGDPVRIYPFGQAPQGVVKPYVVWRNISGLPLNHLNSRPKTDNFNIQVDVYGSGVASVRAVTIALNDALETQAHIVRWGQEGKDPTTGNNRFDFDVDFFASR